MWAFKEHCQNVCCVQAWDVSRRVSCAMFPYWIFRSECWLSPSSFIFLKFLALVGCTSYISVLHIALFVCVCVCVALFSHVFTTLIRMRGPPTLRALAASAADDCWLARNALHAVTPLGCLQTCMWNLWLSKPRMCFLFNSWAIRLKSCTRFYLLFSPYDFNVWTSRRVTIIIIKTLFSVMWGADVKFPLFLLYVID